MLLACICEHTGPTLLFLWPSETLTVLSLTTYPPVCAATTIYRVSLKTCMAINLGLCQASDLSDYCSQPFAT